MTQSQVLQQSVASVKHSWWCAVQLVQQFGETITGGLDQQVQDFSRASNVSNSPTAGLLARLGGQISHSVSSQGMCGNLAVMAPLLLNRQHNVWQLADSNCARR